MTTINYEIDQAESITQANDAKSLSDQVIKLRNLEDKIVLAENNLKKLQEEADILSGDVIPTMMQEMNISTLKLADGSIKTMDKLDLGDILEGGSRVDVLMKIDNKFNETFYKFPSKIPGGEDIYVTGTHMIFSEREKKFIEVNDHPDAIKTEELAKWFMSLITDDHKIKIGGYEFWDWEDDVLKIGE